MTETSDTEVFKNRSQRKEVKDMSEEFNKNVENNQEVQGNESVSNENMNPISNEQHINEQHTDGTGTSDSTYSWVNPKIREGGKESGIANEDMAKHATETINNTSQTYHNTSTGGNASGAESYNNNHNNQYNQSQTDGGQGAQNHQRAYYHVNEPVPGHDKVEHMKKNKTHKPGESSSMGRRWAVNISMALVFGLVAGAVMYGVNYAGGQINGSQTTPTIQNTPVATGDTNGLETTSSSKVSGTYTVAEVAKSAMPSMVAISTETVEKVESFFGTYSQTLPASGSGVIVGQNDDELLIATNNHVVDGADKVSVAFIDDTAVEAQIKGTDSDNDLAVVAVKLADIPEDTMNQIKIATLGDSDSLEIGEDVVAIGNALGYGQSVTNGIISATNRTVQTQSESGAEAESTDLIQTNAAINPGNSGGALLNMKGELIGINEAKYSDTSVEGMGFAIPLSKAEPILQDLMNMQTRSKVEDGDASYIGISGTDVSSQINSNYSIPVGVYVKSVEEGGPAANAGIRETDVITELDGRKVTTMDDLKSALEYYAKGESVDVKIQRMGDGEYKEQTVSVTLGAKSDMKTSTPEAPEQNQDSPFGR